MAEPLELPPGIEKTPDVCYAEVAERTLLLDLYRPERAAHAPLLVWVHGGAWRRGSKDQINTAFVGAGYAMASIDFRSSEEAPFPAQIFDLKAAIRFLRGESVQLGVDATKIAILGVSSGGHLAALTAVTNGHPELKGDVGQHSGESSDVQAAVSYFGASNLTTILDQSTPHGFSVRVPALDLLLGGQPASRPELARLASPVFHVDETAPPLLLVHGDQDPQMPINQAHELQHAYEQHGRDVEFVVVHGAGHGGEAFVDSERNARVTRFLDRVMRRADTEAST